MISLLLAFGWSVIIVGISGAKPTDPSPTQSEQNSKHTTSLAVDDKQEKRSFVIDGDNYAGPNREIETLLRGIQELLSEMQKQLQDLKPVTEKETGEGEGLRRVMKSNFVSLFYLLSNESRGTH